MKEFSFNIDYQFNNYKVIDFLKAKGVSLEIIKKIKIGGIYINGVLLNNINNQVFTNDVVKILLPNDETNPYIKAVKGDIDIVYEDDYILAVDKKKGVLTHSSKYNDSLALDSLVCGYFYPQPFTFRAVNRLDKDTSGIVLIAKDMLTASLLGNQMKSGEFIKTYLAIVVGKPNKNHFVIEKPIMKESENSIKRVCSEKGKYAKTECFYIGDKGENLSIINVVLHTGRTHQIRVHLSSINLPLYADSLYGEKVEGKTYYLHANALSFIHPYTNENITIKSKRDIDVDI